MPPRDGAPPTAPMILTTGALDHRATHQFQRYHAFETNVHRPLLIFELLLVDKNGGGQLSDFIYWLVEANILRAT